MPCYRLAVRTRDSRKSEEGMSDNNESFEEWFRKYLDREIESYKIISNNSTLQWRVSAHHAWNHQQKKIDELVNDNVEADNTIEKLWKQNQALEEENKEWQEENKKLRHRLGRFKQFVFRQRLCSEWNQYLYDLEEK